MSNLRIIADNAADRATLAASDTAGALAVTNLQNDRKGQPWRATSTAARLGATWTTSELIGGMFLPFCNLSPTATMRARVSNEPVETNLMAWSENMSSGAHNNVDAQRDQLAAPDGSMTMDKLVETTVNSTHYSYRNVTLTAGVTYTWSILAKGNGRGLKLRNTTLGAQVYVDLSTGQITTTGGGGYVSSEVQDMGGGLYRIFLTYLAATTASHNHIKYLTSGSLDTYAGDGVSGAWLWGEQVVVGASRGSYYPSADTFTSRASVGTFFASNGLLQTAAINVARMQYNPLKLSAPPKLLVEPAATNILPYSEGTVAQTGGSNVTNAAVTIPGFANTLQFGDNSLARYSYRSATLGTSAGSVYTLSVFMAMDDGGIPVIGLAAAGGADFTLVYEGATFATANIAHVGNGVYRVSRAVTAAGTGHTSNGVVKYTTQSARGFRVTGYQLELGAYPSSYIPTGAAAATRAADVATSVAGNRPAGYIDNWQSYDYDSGAVPACPAAAVKLRGFTPAQAASAYAYGGGAYARHWLPAQMQALGLAIDIDDPANAQGYVEAARLVVGEYWSPANNPDYGASVMVQDASKHYRTDGGDLLTDVGTRARKMPLSLSAMPPVDRTALLNIMRGNGMAAPMLVSLFPGSADLELERDHTVYGKLSTVAAMALPNVDRYAAQLDIEEV